MKHLFEVQHEDKTIMFDLHRKLVTVNQDTYYSYFLEDEDLKEVYEAVNVALSKIVEKHFKGY